MIKTFRAKMAEDEQVKIPISGGDPAIGFRIHSLKGIPVDCTGGSNEAVIKVYRIEQTSIDEQVDLNDDQLLGVFFFLRDQGVVAITSESVIFDRETINQDIYVTYADSQTSTGFNFMLELEEVKMSGAEQAVVNFNAIIANKN